ncbi:MAG TPA: CPBP family intramembrane glutamic endopeptidase [Phycisphaerae bacterium]|nr:CPBP family intramembrane glutamic endopeptidase [Phycisphaerae bacterium]
MSRQGRDYFRRRGTYRQHTHRPLNCLLFLLPMLVAFHLGTLVWGTNLLAWRDVHRVLKYFGTTVTFLPALVVAILLLIQHWVRRDAWRFQPLVLAGMLGESGIGILPLIAISHLTGKIVMHAATATAPAWSLTTQQVLSGIGAGIYEEFIFRMLLIGIILVILVDALGLDKHIVATVAVLLSAALFSLYHFPAEQLAGHSPFPWKDFTFRALAGAYLGVVYIARGFGVCAGVHALFNVYVTMVN